MGRFFTGINIFIGCNILLFVVGVWGAASERFQLLFVSKDAVGLSPVALIALSEGDSSRKFVNDVIWFPLKSRDQIYLGDSISVFKNSMAELEFKGSVKSKIKIGPETLVKIRTMMKKPMISLSKGEVEISGDTSDAVFISSGLRVEKVQIRKNVAVKVRRTDDGDLEVKVYRTDLKNDQGKEEIGQSKDKWVRAATADDKDTGIDWGDRALKYPYPVDQMVFLAMSDGKLTIFPKEKCEIRCDLQIFSMSGERIFEKKFAAGDRIIGLVNYKKNSNLDLRWTLQDADESMMGSFAVKPYSQEEFQRYIKAGRPMEVLTGL